MQEKNAFWLKIILWMRIRFFKDYLVKFIPTQNIFCNNSRWVKESAL